MREEDPWLAPWGLVSVSLGGASLIVPLYVVELGGTAYTLGIMAAVAAFIGVPGALLAGPIVDRGGRHRLVVLGSIALIGLMLAAIALIQTIRLIVVANALIWLAFASSIPVLTLLAVTDQPEETWSDRIARLNWFQGSGWAAGLVLGALGSAIASLWWGPLLVQRAVLFLYAGVAGLAMLTGWRLFPTAPSPRQIPEARRVRRAIANAARFNIRGSTFPVTPGRLDDRSLHPRRFIHRYTPPLAGYFGAIFLCFAGFAAFFAPLPAFLAEAAFSDGEIFALYVVSSLAAAACFGWAGRLTTEHGAYRTKVAGLVARAAALPLVALVVAVIGVGVVGLVAAGATFALIGATWSLIIVAAGILVTRLSPPSIRGESLGVYSALMAFAGGVGSIIGGRLALLGYAIAFGAAAALVLSGAILVLLVASWGERWLPAEAGPIGTTTPTSHDS